MIKRYQILNKIICVFAVIIACFSMINIFNISLSEINYSSNKKFDDEISGIIYNQSGLEHIKYGFGNIADNGCGAISLYNILLLDGRPVKFSEIVREIDKHGLNFYGFVGTNPITLSQKLIEKGFKVDISLVGNNFEQKLKQNKYSILVYFSLQSGHFQLINGFDEATNKFELINPHKFLTYQNLLDDIKDFQFRLLISVN